MKLQLLGNRTVVHVLERESPAALKLRALLRNRVLRRFGVLPARTLRSSEWQVRIEPRGTVPVWGPAAYAELARLLRRLHAVPAPRSPALQNPLLTRGRYDAERVWTTLFLPRLRRRFPRNGLVQIEHVARKLRAECSLSLALPPRLIHGDLNPGNILRATQSIRLIDWEDARVDAPHIDLANVLVTHDPPPASAAAFLHAYDPALHIGRLRYFLLLNALWDFLDPEHAGPAARVRGRLRALGMPTQVLR